ncbi:MAG: anion permease [Ruminococcus sp.]|nr:anion permease [Ruminococcus sp.]
MTALIIFVLCIFLFILDRFPLASVAALGCTALVIFKACTVQEAFSGFTSDIVFIVFGTEIFGIAFQESGLSTLTARFIRNHSNGSNSAVKTRKIIVVGGTIAAVLSSFLNNQVVCSLMLVICMSISAQMKDIKVRDITLPLIYFAILGGQCTLIGAPATLAASSVSEKMTGYRIAFFELLPMGAIIFVLGVAYICISGYRNGVRIWGNSAETDNTVLDTVGGFNGVDRKKCIITALSGFIMLILFITETFSVGTVSLIGAMICIFGGAVEQNKAFSRLDWNILIWLGCSIGMANVISESGALKNWCDAVISIIPDSPSPYIMLAAFVLLTTFVSNLIANTTTVIMILPFAIQLAERLGWSTVPFVISITMAAGLSVLTPLSCGFIGMTVRVGYKFSDYVRYGLVFQLILTISVIVLTFMMYEF